jgi:hypothetical protein
MAEALLLHEMGETEEDDDQDGGIEVAVKDGRVDIFQITQGACMALPDRCGYECCRFNLIPDDRDNNRPKQAKSRPRDLSEPCALKIANLGDIPREDIAIRLGLTRQRVNQIESAAIRKLRMRFGITGVEAFLRYQEK